MKARLSAYTSGRDNNFTLIRLVAASAVLVSHSFTLATGNPDIEPFGPQLGMTIGTIALDVFFVTSGFLVTGSLLARNNIVEFFAARALRIYPGLWVSQILTVVIVGFWLTTETPRLFFSQWETWHYLFKNCVLVRNVDFLLPGAFQNSPRVPGVVYPSWGEVNGPLWTLPVELRMYVYLGMSWLALRLFRKAGDRVFIAVCAGIAIAGLSLDLGHLIFPTTRLFSAGVNWALPGWFFLGASFRLLQNRIAVSRTIALCMALVLLVSMVNPISFGIVYRLTLAYLLMYFAVVARPFRFSPRGDYSYGIYIYAFPIQQTLVTTVSGITILQLILSSFVITFAFAFASWHGIEKHALRMKEGLVKSIPRVFAPSQQP